MSVTYGFYNSINGDRKYNALEMSSIFDGIIVDGVYMSIGDALNVKSSGGMGITVGIGRAWFNHTWTLNDSIMPLTLESSDVLLNRIDAVVLEINNDSDVRKNTIKILKGTPASNPVKPSLIKSEMVNQYPLAYITIGKGVLSISQSNIENAIGTSACPYVTGVLKGMDIDKLVAQWGAQWAEWLSSNTDAWKAFMSDNTNEWKSFMAKNKNEWSALINGNTSEFETWFEHMKDQLSEDAAGNLQLQVDNLNNAALGGDFVLKGSSVSVEYMGANRIASITAYGENAQGGTTEAPVPLTGISSVTVNDDVTELPIPRPLRRVGDVKDKCITRVKSVYDKRVVLDGSADEVFIQTNSIDGWIQIATESDAVIPESTSVAGVIKSSYLKAYAIEEVYSKKYSGISVDSNRRIRLSFKTSEYPDVTSVETARTYLSAHPLTVYYQSTAYNGTNGLDVCLTEYQTGFVELDGTEDVTFHDYGNGKRLFLDLSRSAFGQYSLEFSHGEVGDTPTIAGGLEASFNASALYRLQIVGIHDTWTALGVTDTATAKTWLAAQKAAGTPVQIAYQLATPEVYATDPVDFDNAAGPLTVLTGGELEAAFKSADKVVESRIDFVEDTLNEQGQAIAEKAPISHSSDKSTYGLGSGSQFGHVKLSDATASGSNAGQGIAATPSAVNQVHAKANAAQSTANAAMPKAGGTFTGTVAAKTENIAGAYIRNISVQNSASQLQYTNFIIMVRK